MTIWRAVTPNLTQDSQREPGSTGDWYVAEFDEEQAAGSTITYRIREVKRPGSGDCSEPLRNPGRFNFQFDTTVGGRILKLSNIVDEYTRECPAIVVDRSIDADKVVATLDRLMLTRGAPADVWLDNGPEFIANAIADWCRFNGAGSIFIDPGSPWQNAWTSEGSIGVRAVGSPSPCPRQVDREPLPTQIRRT